MVLGSEEEESSTAFIRVKLTMAFSKISDNPDEPVIDMDDLADQRLIEYETEPDTSMWHLIDFNDPTGDVVKTEDYVPDYWYVLKQTDDLGRASARIAKSGETFEFLEGFIKLSKTEITNKHANCKFHVNYSVEAIQSVNVPDPIVYPGYGPWYNFMKGDIEDLG